MGVGFFFFFSILGTYKRPRKTLSRRLSMLRNSSARPKRSFVAGWLRNRTGTGNRNRRNRFFPKPKAEPEPPEPFSRNRHRNRNRPFPVKLYWKQIKRLFTEEPSEPKTGTARTAPPPNRNRTEPGSPCRCWKDQDGPFPLVFSTLRIFSVYFFKPRKVISNIRAGSKQPQPMHCLGAPRCGSGPNWCLEGPPPHPPLQLEDPSLKPKPFPPRPLPPSSPHLPWLFSQCSGSPGRGSPIWCGGRGS